MSRISYLILSIINLFLLIGFGVRLVSAESPIRQPAIITAPQGNTLDCIPNRRGSQVTTTTVLLVGTIWRENGAPDGLRAQTEPKADNIIVTATCSSDSGGTNDSVVTTSGLLVSGVYSIPINISGIPTDTQFTMRATLPQNNHATWQHIGNGNNANIDNDVNSEGYAAFSIPTTITAATTIQIDVGLTTIAPDNTLTGVVWEDTQLDGLRGNSEPLHPHIPIGLTCPTLPTLQTATEPNGTYALSIWYTTATTNQLCQLSIEPPTGYKLTEANVGNDDSIDSDFATDTLLTSITISSSVATPAQDAGITPEIPLATHLTNQQSHIRTSLTLNILLVCSLLLFTQRTLLKYKQRPHN